MNSLLTVTDKGNYRGIPGEWASETILAYASAIEECTPSTPWLTSKEEFQELRKMVKNALRI